MSSLVRDRRRKTFGLAGFFAAVAIALLLTAADAEGPLAQEGAQIPAAALSSVGSSGGKAVTVGFGADEIGDATKRASFFTKSFSAVSRGSQQVVLVDDDGSSSWNPDVGPTLSEAIKSATGTAPTVIDVADGANGPALSQLSGKTVVWATGQDWGDFDPALNSTDQTTLTNFLNGGGKLVLNGMDAMYSIEDSSFVTNTLGLNVQSDVGGSANAKTFEGSSDTEFGGESYAFDSPTAFDPWHDRVEPAEGSATAIQGVYPPDTTAPTVGSVSPTDEAKDIELSTDVVATFSESMDSSTLSASTFTLTPQDSTTPVNAPVSYDEATMSAMLDPSDDLAWYTTYTATIKGGSTGAKDSAGNALKQDYTWTFTTGVDTTPPSTTPTLSPQPNSVGWNKEDTTLTLSAKDNASGVKQLSYSVNGVEQEPVLTDSAQIPITEEGETTVSYQATDNADNAETEKTFKVKLDKSAPTSSATAKDSAGNSYISGTFTNKNVTVDLSAADESGSGIKDISYSLNGGANKTYNPTDKIVVSSEGESTISYFATDKADNQESPAKTLTVNIDKSAPTVGTTTPTAKTGVSRTNPNITAMFSEKVDKATLEQIDPTTLKTANVKLTNTATKKQVAATVSCDADPCNKVTITPKRALAANTKYKVTVTPGVKDLAGNALDQNPTTTGSQAKNWTFTTGKR